MGAFGDRSAFGGSFVCSWPSRLELSLVLPVLPAFAFAVGPLSPTMYSRVVRVSTVVDGCIGGYSNRVGGGAPDGVDNAPHHRFERI